MKFAYLKQISYLDQAFHLVAFIVIIISVINHNYDNNQQALAALIIFSSLGLLASIGQLKSFIFFFLLGICFDFLSIRISSLTKFNGATEIYFIICITKLLQFLYIAYYNINHENNVNIPKLSSSIWHLIMIRISIGLLLSLNAVPKLFTGNTIRAEIVSVYTNLGFDNASAIVILVGLLEMCGALGFILGLFTKITSLATSILLFIITIAGNNLTASFLAYEYQIIWILLTLSFYITGSQQFSVDAFVRYRIMNCPREKYKTKLAKFILSITK